MYGLTPWGFWPKPLETIIAELEAGARAAFGNDIDVRAAPMEDLIGIPASAMRELWEVAAAIYAAQDPDGAEGAVLEQIAAITGTTRRTPTRSLVRLRLTLNALVTVPAGSIVSAPTTGSRWQLLQTAGPFAGPVILNDQPAEALEIGPVAAGPTTITQIETPVAGWLAVTNPLEADEGLPVDDDPTLRTRREVELDASGAGTADTVRARVAQVATVQSVVVNENTTDITVGTMPPHSIEVLVWDGVIPPIGSDALIAEAIWRSRPAGIELVGTTTATVIDGFGNPQLIGFTRLARRDVWLSLDVQVSSALGWTSASADDLARRLSEWGDRTLRGGDDLVLTRLYSTINATAGLVDTTAIRAGFTVSPVGTVNLAIGSREIADLDAARIAINVTFV